MKIDRVIISTTSHKKYLDFWPIVSKSWQNFGVVPTLIYTSNKKIKFDPQYEVININIKEIDPIFAAQNSRLLVPSLFPNDVCILSDLDIMPLSKKYFFDKIKKFDSEDFVIYRPDACPPNMLALCFNASVGKTWSELFEVSSYSDIKEQLSKWYSKDYIPYKKGWYFDQMILREKVEKFRIKYPNRVKSLSDKETKFNRLNRNSLKSDLNKYLFLEEYFTDFHMPRPYKFHKRKIKKVYNKAFNENI